MKVLVFFIILTVIGVINKFINKDSEDEDDDIHYTCSGCGCGTGD